MVGRVKEKKYNMTNYEKIKNMSMAQMIKMLDSMTMCGSCPCYGNTCKHHTSCKDSIKEWLELEEK